MPTSRDRIEVKCSIADTRFEALDLGRIPRRGNEDYSHLTGDARGVRLLIILFTPMGVAKSLSLRVKGNTSGNYTIIANGWEGIIIAFFIGIVL